MKFIIFLIIFLLFLNRNFRKEFFLILFLPLIIYILKRTKFNNLEELVSFTYNFGFGIIRPMQIEDEILEFLRIIKEKNCRVIIEIGTAKGGTLFLFSRVASSDATLISIDLPGGKFGGGYQIFRILLYRNFRWGNQKIFLLRANSHDESTLEKVIKILNGRKIDMLYIDGDHTYFGVKKDFEMYRRFVKSDGLIVFHDIVSHNFDPEVEVFKFWKEIKDSFKSIEICSKDKISYGIGIVKNENRY